MLIISVAGYFVFSERWVNIITNHLGGLGITGLLACLTGFIAKKKGYNYWRTFSIGFLFPIIIGAISAFMFSPESNRGLPLTCGGWISLVTGIVIITLYSFIKKKDIVLR